MNITSKYYTQQGKKKSKYQIKVVVRVALTNPGQGKETNKNIRQTQSHGAILNLRYASEKEKESRIIP